MGFWIFMMIMSLLIPITMIGFGSHFIKNAPKDINYLFGYRTGMSMKNKDTWEYAHHYSGKIWRITGWVTLIISIIIKIHECYIIQIGTIKLSLSKALSFSAVQRIALVPRCSGDFSIILKTLVNRTSGVAVFFISTG